MWLNFRSFRFVYKVFYIYEIFGESFCWFFIWKSSNNFWKIHILDALNKIYFVLGLMRSFKSSPTVDQRLTGAAAYRTSPWTSSASLIYEYI